MPHYEIHHTCKLTRDQVDALASAITNLHCTLFSAPSIFVNITFHRTCDRESHIDGRNTTGDTQYIRVGGRDVMTNYIIGHIRPRGPENRHKLNTLVEEIIKIWNTEARPGLETPQRQVRETSRRKVEMAGKEMQLAQDLKVGVGRLDDERGLHNVFIMEDIVAGMEQGFMLPLAGQDGKWIEDNMAEFEKRAADGDESIKALVEEIKNKQRKEQAGVKSKL